MLKRKHSRVVVASLVVLACLAGARADLVLCMGSDGHVEIESAVHGVCTDPDSAPPESGLIKVSAGHCGHCLDVPLESGPALRTCDSRVPLHGFAFPFVMLQSGSVYSAGDSARVCILRPPPSNSLDSPVLRI